jgi:hydrogenase expression/formation protein HypD
MAFMEVCGTHTMNIARFGIRSLLPANLRLISGPGCPVCVTPNRWIDRAIATSRAPGVILATFGDMIRVPGSASSLERESARGADVRVVASTLEAMALARENSGKRVVFAAVGFETTSPTVAVSIREAKRLGIANYFVLCGHKRMPPALDALVADGPRLDGYLCPGHVSAILGSRVYERLARVHRVGCVIAGFEPLDILHAILLLVRQVRDAEPRVENPYSRAVTPDGNVRALEAMTEVFEPCDSEWRGLGLIPESGLRIRKAFEAHDAILAVAVDVEPTREPVGCRCGEVLRGTARPTECGLFGNACTPDHPAGACMVSVEGTCAAEYRYGQSI